MGDLRAPTLRFIRKPSRRKEERVRRVGFSQVSISLGKSRMSNGKSILVLGAGELGMAMLRALARRTEVEADLAITVLLRPSTIASNQPEKSAE